MKAFFDGFLKKLHRGVFRTQSDIKLELFVKIVNGFKISNIHKKLIFNV